MQVKTSADYKLSDFTASSFTWFKGVKWRDKQKNSISLVNCKLGYKNENSSLFSAKSWVYTDTSAYHFSSRLEVSYSLVWSAIVSVVMMNLLTLNPSFLWSTEIVESKRKYRNAGYYKLRILVPRRWEAVCPSFFTPFFVFLNFWQI